MRHSNGNGAGAVVLEMEPATAASLKVSDVMARAYRREPVVRVAGPADESEVCRLLLLAHAENAVMPASNEKVLYFVRRFLNGHRIPDDDSGPRGVFGVIGLVGALEALVMIGIGNFWYTLDRHLEEYVVFVDPNFRTSGLRGATGHGIALIEWAKGQSRRTGLRLVTGILSNHRTEAKCRLYRRMLPKVGEYFYYTPDGDDLPRFTSDEMTGPGSLIVELSSMAA